MEELFLDCEDLEEWHSLKLDLMSRTQELSLHGSKLSFTGNQLMFLETVVIIDNKNNP